MTTTQLKLISLIFMLIDHIGKFIPHTPIWLRYIGRLSAPIFFFCMAWGFFYTRNKVKYLTRMYLFGIGMATINLIINLKFCNESHMLPIENNIFITLFISCLIIFLIENYHKIPIFGFGNILLFLLIQIISTTLIIRLDYMNSDFPLQYLQKFLGALLGNVFISEGKIPFIILGVILYFTKHDKKKLIITYCTFCFFYSLLYCTNLVAFILLKLEPAINPRIYMLVLAIPSLFGIHTISIYAVNYYGFISYQWMMLFALPLIIVYNGKKGKGYKYLFYLFYPLHIYLLYYIGNII